MLTINLGRGSSLASKAEFKDAQWLGTVVDERTGMRGALMLGSTGRYFLVQRRATWPLDEGEVLAAMEVEAGLRQPLAAPRPMGRPVSAGGRMHQRAVMLTDAQSDYARKLGKGNLSVGVRACIDAAINMEPSDRR